MNLTLLKSGIALLPTVVLLSGAVVLFVKTRSSDSLLQLLGAGCLVIVVLTHLAEAWHLFPAMRWGEENSLGHYVDLANAVLGGALFPLGYLLHALTSLKVER